MIIAKISDGKIEEYPIFPGDFRRRFPDTLFPSSLSTGMLTDSYVEVLPTPRPEFTRWQYVNELPPAQINGTWSQQWQIIDAQLSLDEKKEQVKSEADRIAKNIRDRNVAHISPAEMASWPIKLTEAIKYQTTSNSADAQNLLAEAVARGCTLEILVEKVLVNATRMCALEAAISGKCGAIQDAASNATGDTDLIEILNGINDGWPE